MCRFEADGLVRHVGAEQLQVLVKHRVPHGLGLVAGQIQRLAIWKPLTVAFLGQVVDILRLRGVLGML